MKKILRISTMLLLVVFLSLGFAGCKPTLEKINVDLDTIKTEYFVGQAQETYENAEVFCVYSNGDLKAIEDKENITFSSISTTEVGTQTLTVTYKGKTQEITITIREKEVTAISVTGLKTAYVLGEAQNNACTVTATFEDNTTAVIPTSEVTFTTISTAEVGTQTITVTYKGVSQNITVYVNEKTIDRIEVDEETLFLNNLYYGDVFADDERCCEVVVTVYYEDGTNEEVYFDDLTFSDVNTTPADLTVPQTLTISYKGVSTTVDVTILERLVESIEIIETDLKLNYDLGDTVDAYTNLKINILYNNGTSDEGVLVSSLTGAVVTKPTIDTIGTSTLKVEYKGFEDTATVSVTEKDVKSVTLSLDEDEFYTGDNFTNNITVSVTYTDDSTRPLTVADVTISETFNINEVGYQTLAVSYKGTVSNQVNVTVYGSKFDKYYISQWGAPQFVTTYRDNIALDSESDNGFYVNKNSAKFSDYTVGDDNPFIFMPTATGYASILDEEPTKITEISTVFTIYHWNWTDETETVKGWVKLTGSDISHMIDDIDYKNSSVDFSENAIGERFKIEVLPFFDEEITEPVSFDFIIKDGYNVYKAEELSLFDNTNYKITNPSHEDYNGGRLVNGIWKEFKEENELWGLQVNGLFIHTNLALDETNVSSLFFYQPNDIDKPTTSTYGIDIDWSFRDFSYVYQRTTTDTPFEFNGNYFQIDASGFPLIAYFDPDKGNHPVTHAALFYTDGDGTVNFKNTKFLGNAQRTNTGEGAGGLILAKIYYGSTANFDNLLTLTFGISYYSIEDGATINMTDCKSFDNYSNIIYSFGETTNTVTHCKFSDCGGPIAILAHNDPDKQEAAYGTLVIDSTSSLENFVTGGEAWFQILGANTLVQQLKPLASALQTASNAFKLDKTFIRIRPGTAGTKDEIEEINLIAVVMHEEGPAGSASNPIKGKVLWTNAAEEEAQKENQTPLADLLSTTGVNLTNEPELYKIIAVNAAAPIIQAGGKTIFTDGKTGFYKLNANNTPTQIGASEAALFADNYLGLSVKLGGSRFGALLQFFDV